MVVCVLKLVHEYSASTVHTEHTTTMIQHTGQVAIQQQAKLNIGWFIMNIS